MAGCVSRTGWANCTQPLDSPMILLALSLASPPVHAGYGDPEDGYPSYRERVLHLFTNYTRVDPQTFADDYESGGCSFESFLPDEQSGKNPLYFNLPLNEAARFHSQDMSDTGNFSHDSSDGTSFGERVARWYSEGGVGENIAFGYGSEWNAQMYGWMCSDGHRANIMSAGYQELGTGIVNDYYTQDFGGGAPDTELNIPMGAHFPPTASAGETVQFTADYLGPEPVWFEVVIEGTGVPLELWFGDADRGVYTVDTTLPDQPCVSYYFAYEAADEARGTFPEEGSYLLGADCSTWRGLEPENGSEPWVPRQLGITGRDDATPDVLVTDLSLVGCTSVPGAGGLVLAGLGGLLAGRRRRS